MGCPASELAVRLVGDRSIRRYNRDYLGKDRPTNVISFAMGEGEFAAVNPAGVLGDVLISVETAAREAAAAGISLQERLSALLVHGILHLAGYDHERSGLAAARRMQRKERQLLQRLAQAGLLAEVGTEEDVSRG